MSNGPNSGDREPAFRGVLRIGVAVLILAAAIAAACIVMVSAGQAEVITRFGNPLRIITEPGLAWKLPVPMENSIPIDLRLRTTSTGLADVGTRDGLRVYVQAYVAWQVPNDPQGIRQFLRSVRNQPDEAARLLRSYVIDRLHVTASNFDLADLVNVDAQKVRLDAFEDQVRAQVAPRMLQVYGIDVRQIGIERMTLPEGTLAATVARMGREREVEAAKRTAEGVIKAAAIRADAEKEARKVLADANEKASHTEANAQQAAAAIYQKAYQSDPLLYKALRDLDTIKEMVKPNTNIILRTDSAPFQTLVDGPPTGLNGTTRSAANSSNAAKPAATPAQTPAAAKPAAPTPTSAPAKTVVQQNAPVSRKDVTVPDTARKN